MQCSLYCEMRVLAIASQMFRQLCLYIASRCSGSCACIYLQVKSAYSKKTHAVLCIMVEASSRTSFADAQAPVRVYMQVKSPCMHTNAALSLDVLTVETSAWTSFANFK